MAGIDERNRIVTALTIKLLLIACLYPGWSILLLLALPNEFNSIAGRSLVGLFALVCLFLIRKFEGLIRYGNDILHFVITVMTVHFIVLVYQSGFSYTYVIGMLVYTTAVSPIIDSIRFYAVFSLIYLLGTAVACYFGGPSLVTTVMIMAGLVTLSLVFTVVLVGKVKLERDLLLSREKLESSKYLASLGRFAGGVAHEINNPLTVVIGNAEMMRAGLSSNPDLTPDQRVKMLGFLEKIERTSKRAAKIVSSLLEFARAAHDDQVTEVSGDSIVETVKNVCAVAFEAGGIKFLSTVEKNTGTIGCVEKDLVKALTSLIRNSIHAVASVEEKWIGLHISCDRANFVFKVSDAGIAPSPDIREKMFQPFFTTKSVGEGEGLGLSVAVGLAMKHGGSIFFSESEPVTTFVMTIPRFLKRLPADI